MTWSEEAAQLRGEVAGWLLQELEVARSEEQPWLAAKGGLGGGAVTARGGGAASWKGNGAARHRRQRQHDI